MTKMGSHDPTVPPHARRFLSWYCVWWTPATLMDEGWPDFRTTYPELQYANRRRGRFLLARVSKRSKIMNCEMTTTKPWRQPRRSNNPSAAVQCPTCGAEPGWRCMVSTGGAMRRNFHKARICSAAAARANTDTRTRG